MKIKTKLREDHREQRGNSYHPWVTLGCVPPQRQGGGCRGGRPGYQGPWVGEQLPQVRAGCPLLLIPMPAAKGLEAVSSRDSDQRPEGKSRGYMPQQTEDSCSQMGEVPDSSPP